MALIFLNIVVNACCAGGVINIYPNENWLSETPIILIEWMEKDYHVYDHIEKFEFHLINESGVKTELEILDKIYNSGTYAQMILRPKSILPESIEVSLIVEPFNLAENNNLVKFLKLIEFESCWAIKKLSDNIKPEIEEVLKFDSESSACRSFRSMNTTVEIAYCENIDYKFLGRDNKSGKLSRSFLLGKLTNQKGDCHYVKVIDNQFQIYDSSCGKTFDLSYGTKYLFSLRLLDLSGNFSTENIDFEITTAQFKVVEYEEIERNGIKGVRICQ